MQFRPPSEFISDAGRNLIIAELLPEADEAEIQDLYRIYKGLGLVLGVAVFEPREPVVGEGVVETRSDRPTGPRAVAADGDAGKGDRGLVRDERGTAGHIEKRMIGGVSKAPAD